MNINDCYYLGKVTKTHGIKGEVTLWFDVDNPEDYVETKSVFLMKNGELIPYFIDELQIRGKKAIAHFEDMKKLEDTAEIINCDMYLPLSVLPALEGNKFYYHEVIGWELINAADLALLGTLEAIYDSTGQDLISFTINEKEILVPITDEILQKVDRTNRQLYLNLPDGLLEIYLSA